jgi:hypothetical protein
MHFHCDPTVICLSILLFFSFSSTKLYYSTINTYISSNSYLCTIRMNEKKVPPLSTVL